MERGSAEDLPNPPVRGTDEGHHDAPPPPFGARLKRLRRAARLTQEELASRAGLAAKAVGALERGERRRPYPHTVRALADALGLPDAQRASLLAAVPGPCAAEETAAAVLPVLPAPPTPLVGREREVEEISSLLDREAVRLLTLTGTGGVGKTRLAIQSARQAARLFEDGVLFVALAPLKISSLVLPTIARALGLREVPGLPPREALEAHLRGKCVLLVLDNFEHLLGAAPEVAELIEACPELRVLATGRAPLRVRAEQEYPVAPLEAPGPGRVLDLEGVGVAPAVELFVERARAASPAFELTRHNAASVAAICRRLGGLPLALELAAARARVMGPAALLSRLDRALESGAAARDLPERQRTMRATLDWSYDLLREPEKDLFARLSVFAGGFALEAAEAVGASEGAADKEDVLVLLENLVEQSLVLAQSEGEAGDGVRYGMLEPVRHYAREKLERGAGAAEEEEARRRHAEYYLGLAEEAGPKLRGHEQTIWLPRLEAELGNLRAALSWCVERGEGQRIARVAWASWTYWGLSGRMSEGRRWMEAALGCEPGMPDASRARLLHIAATLGAAHGDFGSARPANEESMRLFRRLGGDEEGIYLATGTAGLVAAGLGRPEDGLPMLEEAAERALEAKDLWVSSIWSGFAATVALGLGDRSRARRLAERSLSLGREVGARESASLALRTLATIARSEEDLELAGSLFGEGLRLNYEIGERTNIAYFLEGLAEVSAAEGRLERAARLWGAASTLPDTAEVVAYPRVADRAFYERMAAARERLDRRAWEEAWAEGGAMTTEEAVGYALAKHGADDEEPNRPSRSQPA